MNSVEFFNFNDEVWFRQDNRSEKLTETNPFVDEIISRLIEFYPDAYKALEKEYKNICDRRFRNFRIVNRFIKCNWGNIDNVKDIDHLGKEHFERVSCPLRGECRLENVCCSPKFNSRISSSELRVLELLYKGKTKEQIADALYLSIFTVKNHISNAYSRLGIHSTPEFLIYAKEHNLFKEDEI